MNFSSTLSVRRAPSVLAGGCLVLAVFLAGGCKRSPEGAGPSGSEGQAQPKGPTITANPNPVPAGDGKGSTTITWDTGDGSLGQVRFSINNGPEKVWFSKRPRGVQPASWINKGATYEFRLYSEQNDNLLATVKVVRE
jgi:hypothetical protein